MDTQQQAYLELIRESAQVIQQARTEQGWTAGAVALVLVVAILGLAWLVRRLDFRVDELSQWRSNVLTTQVESTVRAMETCNAHVDAFGHRLDGNTNALRDNTTAVHSLRDAIRAAPCGVALQAAAQHARNRDGPDASPVTRPAAAL